HDVGTVIPHLAPKRIEPARLGRDVRMTHSHVCDDALVAELQRHGQALVEAGRQERRIMPDLSHDPDQGPVATGPTDGIREAHRAAAVEGCYEADLRDFVAAWSAVFDDWVDCFSGSGPPCPPWLRSGWLSTDCGRRPVCGNSG